MRLSIRRTFHPWQLPSCPDVFARCAVRTEDGWRDLFRGSPGPFLYMRDQHGNGYDSRAAAPAPEVVVDEAVVQPPCLPQVAWGSKYHVYASALRLCPSQTLEDSLVHEADYWVWKSPQDMLNYRRTTVCFAYDLTGDVRYTAYAQHLIESNFHVFAQGVRDEEHRGP